MDVNYRTRIDFESIPNVSIRAEVPTSVHGYTRGNVMESAMIRELGCSELDAEVLEQDEIRGVEVVRCVDMDADNIHQIEIERPPTVPDEEGTRGDVDESGPLVDQIQVVPLAPQRNLIIRTGDVTDKDALLESLFVSTDPNIESGMNLQRSVALGHIGKHSLVDSTLIGAVNQGVTGTNLIFIGSTPPATEDDSSNAITEEIAEGGEVAIGPPNELPNDEPALDEFPVHRVIAIGKNSLGCTGTNMIRISSDNSPVEPDKRLADHMIVGNDNYCTFPPEATTAPEATPEVAPAAEDSSTVVQPTASSSSGPTASTGASGPCLTVGYGNHSTGYGGALNITVGCGNTQTAQGPKSGIVVGNANEQLDVVQGSITVGHHNTSSGSCVVVGHRNHAMNSVCIGNDNVVEPSSVVLGQQIGRADGVARTKRSAENEVTPGNEDTSKPMNVLIGRNIKTAQQNSLVHESVVIGSDVKVHAREIPEGALSRNVIIGDKIEKSFYRYNVSIGHKRERYTDVVDRRGVSSTVNIGHSQIIPSRDGINVNPNREITIGHNTVIDTTSNSVVVGHNTKFKAEDSITFTSIGHNNEVAITNKKISEVQDDYIFLGNDIKINQQDDGCKIYIKCPGIVVPKSTVLALQNHNISRKQEGTRTLLSTNTFAPIQLHSEIGYIPMF